MPLDGTLAVMRTLDAIRDQVGVRYPQRDGAHPGLTPHDPAPHSPDPHDLEFAQP
ncbi:hypothetical protein SALBM311S_00521 [Streptomyces alboniger]